jgi:Protein of unknown function (DUF3617)
MAPPSGRCARFTERSPYLVSGWTCFCHAKRVFTSREYDAMEEFSGSLCMKRLLLVFCSAVLALLPVSVAVAVELPARKAGLWEMKVLSGGSMPEMTMQQCTDETTDKDMSTAMSPVAKEICSKQDIQKTATGYVTDSVCGVAGMTIKSKAEINGDFNSAYTVISTSHTEGGAASTPRDSSSTIEAKWIGACKPDQKPGDIMMPGGMKMNIKDMQKLKALIPKQSAK